MEKTIKGKKFDSVQELKSELNETYGLDCDFILSYGGEDDVIFRECDFSGLDLTQTAFDFYNWEFVRCKFVGAKIGQFMKTRLWSCDFTNADFSHADMRWCRAENCKVDGANFMGMQCTIDCWFLGGVMSEKVTDGATWGWFGTLPKTPLQDQLRSTIPDICRTLIKLVFQRE